MTHVEFDDFGSYEETIDLEPVAAPAGCHECADACGCLSAIARVLRIGGRIGSPMVIQPHR